MGGGCRLVSQATGMGGLGGGVDVNQVSCRGHGRGRAEVSLPLPIGAYSNGLGPRLIFGAPPSGPGA